MRTWSNKTLLPSNPFDANIAACPLIGPSLSDDDNAALYPGKWADCTRTSYYEVFKTAVAC